MEKGKIFFEKWGKLGFIELFDGKDCTFPLIRRPPHSLGDTFPRGGRLR